MKNKSEFINREISWLSFNERVLQEAEDQAVPLIERMRFLGIYSNNLDEFFKVRVATLRRATGFSNKPIDPMDFDPEETLREIQKILLKQEEKFDKIFDHLRSELAKENIIFINEKQIRKEHLPFLNDYFDYQILPFLVPLILAGKTPFPQLKDNSIYLAVELSSKAKQHAKLLSLIEISDKLPRLITLPPLSGKHYVIFLEDLIRYNLKKIFSLFEFDSFRAYTLKSTRDAELDIDDDFSKSFAEKMSRSLNQRKKGQYVRINYDRDAPKDLLDYLIKRIKIKDLHNIHAGDRYLNKRDLMYLPDFGRKDLCYPMIKPLEHPDLKDKPGILDVLKTKDILLQFPHHSFTNLIDLLREAAIDPLVRTIRITLYRVAKNSQIVNALINAARNGKRVLAVVELQARFDEANNISVMNNLIEAGVRVIPGVHGLKVHSKLILISRKEGNKTVRYVHAGTGNFHEGTAAIYTDLSLLTARKDIGDEVRKIFEFFESNFVRSTYRQLVVSPFGTRRKFTDLINHEIELASKKKPAWIIIKMNNLVDAGMIRKLYEASEAGVKIQLIIRGICSLVPGIPGKSENIRVVSIVGRYLEHSRIFAFGNGGKPIYYISSADWMVRNIDHRIEVSIPVLDEKLKQQLQEILDIQLSENAKARLVENSLKNEYIKPAKGKKALDTQMETFRLLQKNTK